MERLGDEGGGDVSGGRGEVDVVRGGGREEGDFGCDRTGLGAEMKARARLESTCDGPEIARDIDDGGGERVLECIVGWQIRLLSLTETVAIH